MGPRLRKATLAAHVTTSVGWIGAVGVFLALAIVGVSSDDQATVRGAYVAMDTATTYVIVPLAVASLLIGAVQSLGTSWGLVRHYWVVVKLIVTIVATVVLVLQLPTISTLADAATRGPLGSDELHGERTAMVLHSGVGLVVLLVPLALSIFKPRGVTPWGRRADHATA